MESHMMYYVDCETCGLCGPAVLLQFSRGDGPIELYHLWTNPIYKTLELIEEIVDSDCVCGFNLAFDWFQISKIYNLFKLGDPEWYPDEHIEELAILEEKTSEGLCLKPKSALDLMLHARKGPYQCTMAREDIWVKRIPTRLAWQVAEYLEKKIELKAILFANRGDQKRARWSVEDIEDEGVINPEFKNITLRFDASSALKNLAADALGVPVIQHKEISIAKELYPVEFGYAPFCTNVGKPGNWKGAWPSVIGYHIKHWAINKKAQEYAAQDIDLLRRLNVFFGNPPHGDDDSILACMVASVRLRGMALNLEGIKKLRELAVRKSKSAPTDPGACRRWLYEVLDETARVVLQDGTGKPILEEISRWTDQCESCNTLDKGSEAAKNCQKCGGLGEIPTEAAKRARAISEARMATKEIELYDKLLRAGRFYASFKVIGTLSTRMAGADGLNPQGIKKDKYVREQFTLGDRGLILCGGDFDSFEVSIAEAVYKDPKLRQELLSGKKLHALLAVELFPERTYDEVIKSKGKEVDYYDKGKRSVFAVLYGGDGNTIHERVGVALEAAIRGFTKFVNDHPEIAKCRAKIFNMFCSMRQLAGIGTKVEWHEPAESMPSLLGFKRFFTIENKICKALFDLANAIPKAWHEVKGKVVRRDREQTICGATQSALYAAAFAIQAGNLRAAANHEIQSTGGGITKKVEREVWEVQPQGIHPFIVVPINVHDEILCCVAPDYCQKVKEVVEREVEAFRPMVPLIGMNWMIGMESWASKG